MNDDPTDDATNTDDAENTELHETVGDDTETIENGFAALGLRDELLAALDDLGYEEPTPIQRETIPILLTGRDLLGQAATGTGKTAAFALPALQIIDASRAAVPPVLVLVPTRELAVQVSEAMFKYGRELGVRVVPMLRRPADPTPARGARPWRPCRGRHARPSARPHRSRLAGASIRSRP